VQGSGHSLKIPGSGQGAVIPNIRISRLIGQVCGSRRGANGVCLTLSGDTSFAKEIPMMGFSSASGFPEKAGGPQDGLRFLTLNSH
jgi:hypothetical protein